MVLDCNGFNRVRDNRLLYQEREEKGGLNWRRITLYKKVSTEEIKKFGYPLKTYHFTGEYSEQIQGFYIIAGRNKKIVYAPIYEDEKGGTIIDMGQIRKRVRGDQILN